MLCVFSGFNEPVFVFCKQKYFFESLLFQIGVSSSREDLSLLKKTACLSACLSEPILVLVWGNGRYSLSLAKQPLFLGVKLVVTWLGMLGDFNSDGSKEVGDRQTWLLWVILRQLFPIGFSTKYHRTQKTFERTFSQVVQGRYLASAILDA